MTPLTLRQDAPQGASARDWDLDPAPHDPLAAALAAALRAQGRDVDPDSLTARQALPPDGRLTPALAVAAAETHAQRARLIRRRLTDLPDAVLPAILFLTGRDACVLLGWDEGGAARIVWPARGEAEIALPRDELVALYSGHALLLRPDPEADPTTAQGAARPRHWYWSTAARHWPDYLQVVLASALVNILALAVPIFTMNVYDRVFPNAALITLWSLVAGVGLALTFDALLKWVRAGVIYRVGRRVDLAVSATIFRHIADLKLDARAMPSGQLMNTLKDYEQVRDVFSSQTLATLTDLAFAGLFIAVIAYIGGPLVWPPLLALVFVLILGVAVLWPLRDASRAARATGGLKSAVAVEAVTELETLKAISGQGRMQARWERQVAEAARAEERSRRLATFATTATGFAQQASQIGIIVIGVYLALNGAVSMGAVIAAMILSGRALAPTAALSALFVRASFAVATLRSLNELMALPSDAAGTGRHLNARIAEGAVALKAATLGYPEASLPAVREVTLDIPGGGRVGLIGPVGAGKTSLVRLIAGLYAPSDGMVLIDGVNLTQLSPARLRREVQLVPQEAVLFSGSLAENIAFGHPGASDEDILRAARTAGVDRIAAAHPDGFAMPVAERGRNLSGGQRQMVALARALLPRPRVLVLDEPTSAMDMQSEKLFIERLRLALEERPMTLVIATHRMGLLDLVETVVLMGGGGVLKAGPKDEVLKALERGAGARRS